MADRETKIQKSEYLENEKSFLDEKNIFHSFWGAIIWLKIKNWSKIADTCFKKTGLLTAKTLFVICLKNKTNIDLTFSMIWSF